MTFKIDLHLHTNISDGSATPIEMIDEAAKKEMKVIAITDHDTFTVTKQLQDYAKEKNLTLISGIELSCMDETTKRKVHILSYGFNDHHPHMDELIKKYKEHATIQRLKLLQPLNELGFELTKEEVLHRDVLYKQDIALAMEKKGYGKFSELFTTYFRGEKSLEKQFPISFTLVKDAIEAIHKDGGLAVLAHPRTYNTFDQIEKYISWGLDGIEISHPSYQEGEVEKVLHYPLLHFGGSDSHGLLSISSKRQIGNYGIHEEDYLKVKELICRDVHD